MNCPRYSGFTLVELLVVLFIIAILGTITCTFCALAMRKANDAKAGVEIQELKIHLTTYRQKYGRFPTESQFAGAKFKEPLAKSFSYNEFGNIIDPWGTPYVYTRPVPNSFQLFSCGHDRKSGTKLLDADNID